MMSRSMSECGLQSPRAPEPNRMTRTGRTASPSARAAALLEVLDPEQNCRFEDHYLDVPFDLSQVMFIATANTLHTIPPALLDRMEVLELPGYTEQEKLQIARSHLVPRQLEEHGLTARRLEIDTGALTGLIRFYTSEAGLRNLERAVGTLCRKVARRLTLRSASSASCTANPIRSSVTRWTMCLLPRFRYFAMDSLPRASSRAARARSNLSV